MWIVIRIRCGIWNLNAKRTLQVGPIGKLGKESHSQKPPFDCIEKFVKGVQGVHFKKFTLISYDMRSSS